jgi:DAK2 domain fusion protein YloV
MQWTIWIEISIKSDGSAKLVINGALLRDAIISGSNNINRYKQQVNELNVFPVPDGDTGTNMSMTMTAACKEISRIKDCTAGDVADIAASALLRGARGNSGVILSLLFRGIAIGLKDKKEISGLDIADALRIGVESAYKAVMKPTEGTILTVARLAAETAANIATPDSDTIEVFEKALISARQALDNTPELLPILKKAGVVDAGGKGLVLIFEGMLKTFQTGEIIQTDEQLQDQAEAVADLSAIEDEEITFTYCTEFIIDILNRTEGRDSIALRAYLESIGDSVVVVEDASIIKVHVHTNNPGRAIEEAILFGSLSNIKIDNMRLQNEEKKRQLKKFIKPEKGYGIVAIAAGDGIISVFNDLGVDNIVQGGQTMNPSTEDILAAIEATPAEDVFVLPNNKNIIMAAEQAVPLADRRVHVIHTKTIPQGIAAALAFDAEIAADELEKQMSDAAAKISTGLVTFAARDSDFDGHKIKQGEILGLANGKLAISETEPIKAAFKLCKQIIDKNSNFVTIFFSEGIIEEQANELKALLDGKYAGQLDVTIIPGGQPIYYFIISVE